MTTDTTGRRLTDDQYAYLRDYARRAQRFIDRQTTCHAITAALDELVELRRVVVEAVAAMRASEAAMYAIGAGEMEWPLIDAIQGSDRNDEWDESMMNLYTAIRALVATANTEREAP